MAKPRGYVGDKSTVPEVQPEVIQGPQFTDRFKSKKNPTGKEAYSNYTGLAE